jgi:hypothetical protein
MNLNQVTVPSADVKPQPWLWREAHMRDPDGNSLCLFTAGKNRKYPPWRVAAARKDTAAESSD